MSSARRLSAWVRRIVRPRGGLIDAIAAAALAGGALWAVTTLTSDHWVPVTVASAVLCTGAVAWRRRSPVCSALVALTAVVVYQRVGHDTQGSFVTAAIVLTCYSVGRRGTGGVHGRSLGVVLGYALAACLAVDMGSGFSVFGVLLTWIPVAVLPAVAGVLVDRRERLIKDLLVAESRLRDEQALRTARVLAEERTRVARELHDVVAHCVSVMVIQAGAARLVAGTDAVAAREALRAVVSSGREALVDLRRVVGVLRRSDDEFAGQALGLGQLDRLMDGLRGGGLQVRYRVAGEPVELPPDIELTAFRIVQEALTNVLKHAPAARADVSITYYKQGIDVLVEDSGPAGPATVSHGSGHGLIGMRERVALHGGELSAGPTAGGGFAVHARVPLTATVAQTVPDTARPQSVADRKSRNWRRLTPHVTDAVVAGAWLVGLEIEALTSSHRDGPLAANVVAVAAMALAVVIRRRAPLVFLAVIGALTIALSSGLASPERASLVGTYTLFVGAYTIAAYQPRRRALAGLVFLLVGVVVTTLMQHAPPGAAFGGGLMSVLVWLVARQVRRQRELTAALKDATTRLAAEREDRAALALYDERARTARDLHRVVARLVTTMLVQSEAGGDLVGIDDASANDAIRAIEQTGRQALTQMRQMLGVLRNEQSPASAQRQPVATAVPVPSLEPAPS
jgi:signal transduction histidine kinase